MILLSINAFIVQSQIHPCLVIFYLARFRFNALFKTTISTIHRIVKVTSQVDACVCVILEDNFIYKCNYCDFKFFVFFLTRTSTHIIYIAFIVRIIIMDAVFCFILKVP